MAQAFVAPMRVPSGSERPEIREMRNDHNVYVLGAGFSRFRGLPLVADFTNRLRDTHRRLEQQGKKREADAVAEVLTFRLRATSAAYRISIDLENIEDLFSLASAQPDLDTKVQLAIGATLDSCASEPFGTRAMFLCPENVLANKKSWSGSYVNGETARKASTAPAYEFIVRFLLGDWPGAPDTVENSIVTFNYDIVVEDALSGLSVPFCYGFEPAQPQEELADWSQQTGAPLKVLKLHGSINWSYPSEPNGRISVHRNFSDLARKGGVPALLPPTWRKDSVGLFQDVWRRALGSIETATRLIIIGYSAPPTDLHFKYLLAAGLQKNISLREIIFVNDGKEIEQRAEELFAAQRGGRRLFRILPLKLEDFVAPATSIPKDPGSEIGRPLPQGIASIVFRDR